MRLRQKTTTEPLKLQYLGSNKTTSSHRLTAREQVMAGGRTDLCQHRGYYVRFLCLVLDLYQIIKKPMHKYRVERLEALDFTCYIASFTQRNISSS